MGKKQKQSNDKNEEKTQNKTKNGISSDSQSNNNDEIIQKYDVVISIWKRMDESYWTSFNMFLIIEGLLLAGYSQVIDIKNFSKVFGYSIIYSVAGIVITMLWWYVFNKKMAFTYLAEDCARELEEKIFNNGCGYFQKTVKIFHKENNNKKEFKEPVRVIPTSR